MENIRVTPVYISLNPDLVNVLAKLFMNQCLSGFFCSNPSADSTLLTVAGIRCIVEVK